MSAIVVDTWEGWESLINEVHIKSQTLGYAMESNRLYVDNITFEDRVKMLKEKVDITVAIFNPQYQEMVGIDSQLSSKLFGNKPRTPVDEYIDVRKDSVNYVFITPNDLPYRQEVKEWIYINGPLMDINEKLDAYSYIRGCYATEVYLNTVWRESVDYIVSCPWRLKYNIFCTTLVGFWGVNIDYPWKDDSIELSVLEGIKQYAN
jgi:hypothetical protein